MYHVNAQDVDECMINIHYYLLLFTKVIRMLWLVKLLLLLLPPHIFNVLHTTMHQFTVSPYSKPHVLGACVFSCNLAPALLAEWLRSFTCYHKAWKWNGSWNMSGHRKLTMEKKLLPSLLLELKPAPFNHCVITTLSKITKNQFVFCFFAKYLLYNIIYAFKHMQSIQRTWD